ncbi:MAG: acyl-homoserine-lactone synthase [Paracoccaceae bacterium]
MTLMQQLPDIRVDILRMPQDIDNWNLVVKFLRLRKEIFVDEMSWPLFHADAMEFEQYDSLSSVYVIAHNRGQVLGGARLVRTDKTQSSGKVIYTYMIRDAYLGNLPGLPSDLCTQKPPIDRNTWELTRFTSAKNQYVGKAILDRTNEFLKSKNAKRCLFLGPPSFMRMARSMGYAPKPLGKIVGNRDGRFLAFGCDVV